MEMKFPSTLIITIFTQENLKSNFSNPVILTYVQIAFFPVFIPEVHFSIKLLTYVIVIMNYISYVLFILIMHD